MTISQIDPASGPSADYADMATWEAALGSGVQEAVIWGTGDVGGLTLNATDPDSISIYNRPGAMHDGRNNGNTGFAHALATWNIVRSTVVVRGIRFAPASGGGVSVANAGFIPMTAITIADCLFVQPNVAFALRIVFQRNTATGIAFRKNAIYQSGAADALVLDVRGASGADGSLTIDVDHNSLIDTGSGTAGIESNATAAAGGSATLTANVRANAAFGFTADFAEVLTGSGGTETINGTYSHNASGDGTADDFGGSGHLTGQTAGDWFADVAEDLRQVRRSPGVLAGIGAPFFKPEAAGQLARPAGRGCAHEVGHDLRA